SPLISALSFTSSRYLSPQALPTDRLDYMYIFNKHRTCKYMNIIRNTKSVCQ
uniref:Uncharacterized protein n=1 Tax=Amphimedon queenslandica TaxID=400682 RepID=A0A1X7UAK4_AMPQE